VILSDASMAKIRERLARYPSRKSAILPALTIAYEQVGHLNDDIYREISRLIKVPYIEIAEAATFYTLFPKRPVGKYRIMVCHNISCALLGADSLTAYLEGKLGIKKGEVTPDRLFSLETVECLGSCATAPMMQINQDFHENLTREKVDAILTDLKARG
jgi:NADH-quinone oxidoreductase subunit E